MTGKRTSNVEHRMTAADLFCGAGGFTTGAAAAYRAMNRRDRENEKGGPAWP